MKALIRLFALLCVSSIPLYAQPDSLWSRTFGGNGFDACYAIQQTTDGGYILGGQTDSFGAGLRDFYIVKTDSNGNQQWSRTYGGSSYEACNDVRQTADGGYILAGYTYTFGADGGYNDFWLLKINANGDSLWSRTFGGSGIDHCHVVQQTPDGGYILAGHTSSFGAGSFDFRLLKTNANGDSMWSRTFGGGNNDVCEALQQTTDGGYLLAGTTQSFGVGTPDYPNFYLVKTDGNGNQQWSRTFGGSNYDACHAVQLTTDGGYLLAGETQSFGLGTPATANFWLVKTDANGDSLWSRTYGGGNLDQCYAARQTADGGYILVGQTNSFGAGNGDFWFLKTNENGDSLWSRAFGGDGLDVCNAVQQTTDGAYVMVGETNSFGMGGANFWMVKSGYPCNVPAVPGNLVILPQGENMLLTWTRVDTTVDGCPIQPNRYLVFFSEISEGLYYYLAYTNSTETTYTHVGVITHSPSMFYHVAAWIGDPVRLQQVLSAGDNHITDLQLFARLNEK